jgi:hypothetical protein
VTGDQWRAVLLVACLVLAVILFVGVAVAR